MTHQALFSQLKVRKKNKVPSATVFDWLLQCLIDCFMNIHEHSSLTDTIMAILELCLNIFCFKLYT